MLLLVSLVLAAADPGAVLGTVQVTTRGVPEPTVSLVRKDTGATVRLTGAQVRELRALGAATVEVVGPQEGKVLVVQAYRIIAVAGGARPIAVGVVVPVGEAGLGLATDAGPAIPLNAPPKVRAALQALFGAKIWIVGEKLLSGEIRVLRHGVLLEPPRPAPPERSSERAG